MGVYIYIYIYIYWYNCTCLFTSYLIKTMILAHKSFEDQIFRLKIKSLLRNIILAGLKFHLYKYKVFLTYNIGS